MIVGLEDKATPLNLRRAIIRTAKSIFLLRPVEALLRKVVAGSVYGSFISRCAPTHDQYRKSDLREVAIDGIRYRLDPSDLMDWFLYWQFSEPARTDLESLFTSGATIIDVGANIGAVALKAAKSVGPAGSVHAFEPFPSTFAKLEANVALNTFDNLAIHGKGLGSTAQTLRMVSVEPGNAGMNRIAASGGDGLGQDVEVTTLDAFVEDKGLTQVDAIKVDVEGFEFEVLKGAEKILKKFTPSLFIEIDDSNLKQQKSSAAETLAFLEGIGYGFRVAGTTKRISSSDDFAGCHFDVIAEIPKGERN